MSETPGNFEGPPEPVAAQDLPTEPEPPATEPDPDGSERHELPPDQLKHREMALLKAELDEKRELYPPELQEYILSLRRH